MEEITLRNQQEQDEFEQNQVIITPGQMVAKRFFRNKLAGVGMGVIVFIIKAPVKK